jgi:hypothetical protein
MRMSQDPSDPTADLDSAAMDFAAQVQQEIDPLTAKAFGKQVAGMLGLTISEPLHTVTLNQEMLNKAIQKKQETGYQLDPLWRIEQACPGLEENVQPPCDCYIEFYQDAVLSAAIMHLNDKHAWTREKIADWLDSLDIDLTVNLDDEPTHPKGKPVTISPMDFQKENPDWTKQYIVSGNMYVSIHTNPELTIAPSSTPIGKAISS